MQDFLVRYGLLAVVVGAAFEGDVTIIMAGVVAHLGFFGLPLAVEAACLGAFIGDSGWYWLGRTQSARVRQTRFYRRAAPTIERLVARLGAWEVVMARFVYGTRIASMFFWGVHGLPFARFAALDALGCVLSATLLAGLGYVASGSVAAVVGRVKRAEMWLAAAVVVSASVVLGVGALLRRAAGAR